MAGEDVLEKCVLFGVFRDEPRLLPCQPLLLLVVVLIESLPDFRDGPDQLVRVDRL